MFIDSRAKLIVADLRADTINQLKEKLCTQKYDVVVDFLSYTVEQMKKTLNVIEEHFFSMFLYLQLQCTRRNFKMKSLQKKVIKEILIGNMPITNFCAKNICLHSK